MTRPVLPPYRCAVTDEDANPCIRPRAHTGDHHFLVPRRRPTQVADPAAPPLPDPDPVAD